MGRTILLLIAVLCSGHSYAQTALDKREFSAKSGLVRVKLGSPTAARGLLSSPCD